MNTVRITSGKYKGRKIATPGAGTHPMGERERIALFNMIITRVPGAKVLDAYAGSGALGVEALSRGADKVVFVDKNHAAMRTIRKNCLELGISEGQVMFYDGTVGAFCENFTEEKGNTIDPQIATIASTTGFDVILADPPYDNFDPDEVGNLTDKCLKKSGILVLSHPGEAPDLAGLSLEKSHKYAGATISVYVKD